MQKITYVVTVLSNDTSRNTDIEMLGLLRNCAAKETSSIACAEILSKNKVKSEKQLTKIVKKICGNTGDQFIKDTVKEFKANL